MAADSHPRFDDALQAIVIGSRSELQSLLDQHPELATATHGATGATLLHCTGFNMLDELCQRAPPTTPELAQLLLERGADADARAQDNIRSTALCWALSSWHTHQGGVQLSLCDAYLAGGASLEGVDGDGAPLGHAIGFGYRRAVEHLTGHGARVDHLYAAAALGRIECLAEWRRADGSYDETALDFAQSEAEETGRFSWPPPHRPDPGALALVTAATHGRLELVRWLLDQGTPIQGSITRGQTALHFAAYVGHGAIVELLLERGARRDARESQFDRTPAEWARETRQNELAALIENA